MNQLNEKRLLIPWGLRVPIQKINFCSRVLRLSELPRYRKRPQTAICCSGGIKVSRDWFECVLVISFYVVKVFSESVTQSSSCFTNVYLFATSANYAVNDIAQLIGGVARKVISDLNGSLGSRHFLYLIQNNKLLESKNERNYLQWQTPSLLLLELDF